MLTRIGNSQGIRISKPLIEQANPENHKLDFEIVENGFISTKRYKWKENIIQVLSKNKKSKRDIKDVYRTIWVLRHDTKL